MEECLLWKTEAGERLHCAMDSLDLIVVIHELHNTSESKHARKLSINIKNIFYGYCFYLMLPWDQDTVWRVSNVICNFVPAAWLVLVYPTLVFNNGCRLIHEMTESQKAENKQKSKKIKKDMGNREQRRKGILVYLIQSNYLETLKWRPIFGTPYVP